MKTLLAFILGALLVGFAKISWDEHVVDPVPLVQSDYPLCVNVVPHPLLRTPKGKFGFQEGIKPNDRGET